MFYHPRDDCRYFERLSSNGAASSSGRAGGAGAGALGVSALSSTAVMEDCLMPSTAMRILNELSGGRRAFALNVQTVCELTVVLWLPWCLGCHWLGGLPHARHRYALLMEPSGECRTMRLE